MSTHNRYKNLNATFDFSQVGTLPAEVPYSVKGTGQSVAWVGPRIWDAQQLLPSGVLTSSTSLPLTNTYLPDSYFDAIILLHVGTKTIPIAFSNSPDNSNVSTGPINRIAYWTDLWAFGPNEDPPFRGGNSPYIFGGDVNYQQELNAFNIYLSEPTPFSVNFRVSIKYPLINEYEQLIVHIPIGQKQGTASLTLNPDKIYTSGSGAFYLVEIQNPTDQWFSPLLSKFHWGCASEDRSYEPNSATYYSDIGFTEPQNGTYYLSIGLREPKPATYYATWTYNAPNFATYYATWTYNAPNSATYYTQ